MPSVSHYGLYYPTKAQGKMKKISNLLMKGLATVLPIGMTIYVVTWLVGTMDSVMHRALVLIIGSENYRPGMGILAGLVLLIGVGIIVNNYLVKRLIDVWDSWLTRIPLVKTVYSAFRDVVKLLPSGENQRDLQSVVTWRVAGARLLGFVTHDAIVQLKTHPEDSDLVAVYFPMSYMLGGYTLYLPKHELEPVNLSVEEAMRLAITGGMGTVKS
jgi:uncharacterized membrane protein